MNTIRSGQTRLPAFARQNWVLYLAAVFCFASVLCPAMQAQVSSYGDKSMGSMHGDELPQILKKVGIQQHLDQPLPLQAAFRDETGKDVLLANYFGKHPVILSLVYYNCPMLCSEELDGLVSALEMVKLVPGKDFEIVVVSFDPSETPEMAAAKKALYVKRYGHPATANGWHFLSGSEASISELANAVGFGYVRVPGPDGKMTQFAHASSLEIATTQGRLAQYYMGVEYSPRDLTLGLVEASGNKIGTPVDNILTYCYHYDPHINRHSLAVVRMVQFGGMMTVASLGGFMFVMFRRDVKTARASARAQEFKKNQNNG